MNNMQKAFKKKTCLADGGRITPGMLGVGLASRAGRLLAGRPRAVAQAVEEAETGAATPEIVAAPAGAGGLSRIRDDAMPPARLMAAQRRGLRDGGKIRRLAHGGEVDGPGGPTDDKAGTFRLSNDEYVLPADTVDAMGGPTVLDQIRDATHEFVDEGNRPRGLADGGPTVWDRTRKAAGDAIKRGASLFSGAPRSAPMVTPAGPGGDYSREQKISMQRSASGMRAAPANLPSTNVMSAPQRALYKTGQRASGKLGALAGVGELAHGLGGMADGDASGADLIRTGVGAAALAPVTAPVARPLATGMAIADLVPDSVYEWGLNKLGLMPKGGVQLGPEAYKYLDKVGASSPEQYMEMRKQGQLPGQVTAARAVERAAKATTALRAPNYGADEGTGFVQNNQTGRRTNIDARRGLGVIKDVDPRSAATRDFTARAQQAARSADALMSKVGGGVGDAFVARGLRNQANTFNQQALESQQLDDAREAQQLGLRKAEMGALVGMAKIRAGQTAADRNFQLQSRAADRLDGKDRRDATAALLESKFGKQFDKDGNLNPKYAEFHAALQNTLQGRANPDGTPMTVETLPSQELEALAQTYATAQGGRLTGLRALVNNIFGNDIAETNDISGLRVQPGTAKKGLFGGVKFKDVDGRERFIADPTYDQLQQLGMVKGR